MIDQFAGWIKQAKCDQKALLCNTNLETDQNPNTTRFVSALCLLFSRPFVYRKPARDIDTAGTILGVVRREGNRANDES